MKKAGRKAVDSSCERTYRVKRLSSDAKIIWNLLKKQPQNKKELCKVIPMSESTLYSVLPILENSGILKQTDKGYALWFYDEAEAVVIQTIIQWGKIAFRDPDINEIANETSIPLQEVERIVFNLKGKINWKMPNESIKQNAANMLGEVLWCAAQIKEKKISDSDYKNDPKILEQAERFLKEHPEMVPKFQILYDDLQYMKEPGFTDLLSSYIPRDISWPPEALRYMGNKTPKLKARVIPSGVSIFSVQH